MAPARVRSRFPVRGFVGFVALCASLGSHAADRHDPSEHVAVCDKTVELPFSEQDRKIHTVVKLSPGDEAGAFKEMAQKFGISVTQARQAFERVERAESDGAAFAMFDSFHETVACLAGKHGLKLIQPAAPLGTHIYVFVDSETGTANPMDLVADDVLALDGIDTVTVQFHVRGEAKIRRDYPLKRNSPER